MNSIEFTNEFSKVNYLVNRRAKFQLNIIVKVKIPSWLQPFSKTVREWSRVLYGI